MDNSKFWYNYSIYNIYRQLIPKYKNLKKFIKLILFLKHKFKLGLVREWLAFNYLKNRLIEFGSKIEISNILEDFQGIDIIIYNEKNNIKLTFQVIGFYNQKFEKFKSDFIILVKISRINFLLESQNINDEIRKVKIIMNKTTDKKIEKEEICNHKLTNTQKQNLTENKDYFIIPQFKERCIKILKHFGLINQKTQTIQELNNLSFLINKDILDSNFNFELNNQKEIIDKIADVYIMIMQMKNIYKIKENEIGRKIDEKLTLIINKIDNK